MAGRASANWTMATGFAFGTCELSLTKIHDDEAEPGRRPMSRNLNLGPFGVPEPGARGKSTDGLWGQPFGAQVCELKITLCAVIQH